MRHGGVYADAVCCANAMSSCLKGLEPGAQQEFFQKIVQCLTAQRPLDVDVLPGFMRHNPSPSQEWEACMSFHRQMCMDGAEPDLVCKGAALTVCKQLHVWQRALVFLSAAFTEDLAELAVSVCFLCCHLS